MYKPYEPHQIEWRGLPIEVRYCPSWSKSHEDIYGERMAHLEIRVLDEGIVRRKFLDGHLYVD